MYKKSNNFLTLYEYNLPTMKKGFLLLFVIGMLYGCEAIFVENISNATVTILAPTEGTTINSGEVNFNWNAVNDAESYQIQIATPSFTNASQVVLDTIITKTSFSKNITIGNYQWRVKAINSDYQTNYTTTSFEVQ
tara:strand:- start:4822 stop:5229 length:408 start_codon:yes stop_codon:yes gene_type:complete